MSNPTTKRLARALIYGLTAGAIAALRRAPYRIAVALGWLVGRLAAAVARPERRRALENLERVCPRLTADERRTIVRRMFINLGRSALECVVLHKVLRRWSTAALFAEGARQTLGEAIAEGRGVVYVTAHLGNWELMAAAVARFATVPVYVLARPSYDPRFTRLIDDFRRGHGVHCLWVDQPGHLREAIRALRRGAIVGLLIDQPVKSGGDWLPFLGHPAPTTLAAAGLARAAGAAVVAGFIRREDSGHGHTITIERLDRPRGPCQPAPWSRGGAARGSNRAATATGRQAILAETTRAATRAVERAVTQDLAMWTWSLDRWRFGSRPPPVLALADDRRRIF